jgi:hypothetical protein
MKTLISMIVLLSFCAIMLADEPVALALKIQGKIDWTHASKTVTLNQGSSLFNSDNLLSYKDAYASVKFVDGSSLLKVFPNSSVRITASKNGTTMDKKTYLQSGTVYSKVMKKTGVYEVETPKTIASVKGTEFLSVVTEAGDTEIFAFSGTVKLTNRSDGKSADIGPNQKGFSSGSGSIQVTKFDPNDLPGEVKEGLKDLPKSSDLQIEMRGPDGEIRHVKLEFE